jgi:hypothetical protein
MVAVLLTVAAPATANDPVIPTLPVNACVLANKLPKRVDPVTKSTDDVIVCTTNVVAVNVPATVNAFANDEVTAVVANDALTAFNAWDAVTALVAIDADTA